MNRTDSSLFAPLSLPNGTSLPNRIAKAAMEENMAARDQLPGEDIHRLYATWAAGGAGLIITGNVMIDGRAMTGPGGIVLEAYTPLAPFCAWAQAACAHGAQVWMQLNHPGRQTPAALGGLAWAPSDIALDLGKHSNRFARPTAMSEADIAEVIARFVQSARRAEQAGFTCVQIHAAHGYLLSQFLSPISNRRTDQWGGSIENRARLLIETVKAVRDAVSQRFAVTVKLNSADFQRGGFDADDARRVVQMLNDLPVDLVELSGGSYESPAMQGRTLAREAYFLDFARDIAAVAKMPVMTTAPLDIPWKDKGLVSLTTMAVVRRQLQRSGSGKAPQRRTSPLMSLVRDQWRARRLTRRYRGWPLSVAAECGCARPETKRMASTEAVESSYSSSEAPAGKRRSK